MSFMLYKNNLIDVVWIFYHVFQITDHVGVHHMWVLRVFFLCRTWASTLEQLINIASSKAVQLAVVFFTDLESENICNIPKENASNIHVLHRDAWQQMPGQRVVRSMIGELAVALPSAVEAALGLAAYAPLFLMADLAASLHQRNWGVVLCWKEW